VAVAKRGGGMGRQVALMHEGTEALRLNTPGWMEPPPELIVSLPDRASLRLLCRDRLQSIVPSFSASARSFILAYFDYLAARLDPLPHVGEDCITHPSDRYFAALLPLPNVYVAPVSLESAQPVVMQGHDFIHFDLGFWDGETFTGIFFGSPSKLTPRRKNSLDQLMKSLSPRLQVLWVDQNGAAQPDNMPPAIIDAWKTAKPPWFGPYRAAGFRQDLKNAKVWV
jgi:hypothetical protein